MICSIRVKSTTVSQQRAGGYKQVISSFNVKLGYFLLMYSIPLTKDVCIFYNLRFYNPRLLVFKDAGLLMV